MDDRDFLLYTLQNVGGTTRFERALRRLAWRVLFFVSDNVWTLVLASIPALCVFGWYVRQ